jgi:hypothetical protein
MSLIIISFYSEITKSFSKDYNFVDDMTFVIYINSTLCLAILLFKQVKDVNSEYEEFGMKTEKISVTKEKKFYLILLLALQAFSCKIHIIILNFIDSLALIFLSFYNPLEKFEKFAQFILILCLNINSILFLLTWALFVFNLNGDFADVLINMELQRTYEYYIDLDDDNKNVL